MFTALILTLLSVLTPAPAGGVDWYQDGYNKALRDARVGDQLVLIALVPDWSDYSRQVAEETFTDERVAAALGDLLCLKFEQDDAHLRQVAKLYNIEDFPAIVFADSKGRIEDLIQGYIPAEPLLGQLERITSGEGTVSAHQARVDRDPDDLDEQHALLTVLRNVYDWRRAEKVERVIRHADPEAQTPAGARLARESVWQEVFAAVEHDGGPLELEPMRTFIASRQEPRVRFECWNEVGNTLAGQGDVSGARAAFMTAFEHSDQEGTGDWAASVAGWFLADGMPELSADERAFTLVAADVAVNGVMAYCAASEGTGGGGDGGGGGGGDGGCDGCAGCDRCDGGKDGDGGMSQEDKDAWLADRLGLLARAQLACAPDGQAVKLARATVARCLELQPEREDFVALNRELLAMR